MEIQFTKMQGLGNDFVVIDATKHPFQLSSAQIQRMANRRFGVGFDQMLVIEAEDDSVADFRFRIFNADGTEVGQCGNGARCVALFLKQQQLCNKPIIRLSTLGGLLELSLKTGDKVTVSMGVPRFEPNQIPFVTNAVQKEYQVEVDDKLVTFGVVNVGNPHAVITVSEISAEQVATLGEKISRHKRFPEGVNVGFMQVIDPQNIRLRVYERGAGETLACGSGACAAMVIGRRNGLLQERVTVSQPGGSLSIDWQGPQSTIKMTGPAATVFYGRWIDS
ncbi:MAG: diaminopimelate epimerase [Coxiella sp. RIFCSPHIGHO2_12_FULL_42_15]|nr:MAG: diaminopimelate epimerase [Coxiella sp. RIFCSPHIGHO2_12_FULL_42_15]